MNIFSGGTTMGPAAPSIGQFVALPSSGLTFRRLFLPRATKTVRQQVIAEELSYSLPFPLTEAHYGSVESGEEAWVVIASDSVVQPIKELHPKANLEAEPLCYLRAAKAANIEHALVVDFGASKTVFCSLENGHVGSVRVLLRGGDALTEELMASTNRSRQEAEMLKREEGMEHSTVHQFFMELIEEALLPSPLPHRTVLLCGGGSATQGLLGALSSHWGSDVDVEPFPLPDLLMPTDHVVAYGAALAGRFNATRLQMDHSFRQLAAGNGPGVRWAPILATLMITFLMVVATESRLSGLKTKEAQLKSSLTEAVLPVMPNAGELKAEELAGKLKSQVESQRKIKRRAPAKVMNTLGQISEWVTNKQGASLYSVTYEDEKLKLEGRAASIKQTEDIKNGMDNVMDNVVKVKTRPAPKGTFVFKIEGQLRDG